MAVTDIAPSRSEGVASSKPMQKIDSQLLLQKELSGGAHVLSQSIVPGCAFAAYAWAMTRVATPPDGSAATPLFFKGISLALPAVATMLYVVMCLVGPRVMRDRQPFELKGIMLSYNAYQAFFSAWSVFIFIREIHRIGAGYWGNTGAGLGHPEWLTDARYGQLMCVLWLHYNNKYMELLDSVFMILRKKNEQLSFLHCYHHALLIWAWAFALQKMACSDAYFGATCNSIIHAIMYGYYFMAALGVRCPWKKYITQAQLLQFVVCLVHSVYILRKGCCGVFLPASQLFVMVNMLVLFGQFYVKAYSKKREDAAARRAGKKAQ